MGGTPHSRTRTPRIITRVIAFLLLGAIVNVGVAWGFAARRSGLTIERNRQGYFVIWQRPWQVVEERRAGMSDVWWYDVYDEESRAIAPQALVDAGNAQRAHRQASGGRMRSGRAVETLAAAPAWGVFGGDPLPGDVDHGGDIALGWPLLCLWMNTTGDIIGNRTSNERLHGGWLVRGGVETRGNDFLALPYRPLWPGFAINTLFYAGILWVLFAAPLALRRRRRIKRGLCPACAYPVGSSERCTECGARLPAQFRAAE